MEAKTNMNEVRDGTVFLGRVIVKNSAYVVGGELRVMKKADAIHTYIRYGKSHYDWTLFQTQTDVEFVKELPKKDFFKGDHD